MKALVLGGYGAVGARIVSGLRATGDVALAAGRDPARADRVVDLGDRESLASAVTDVDVVVNASGREDAEAIAVVTEHGVPVVDITATAEYMAALERRDHGAPVVLSVGLAPGLTNLLATAVHKAAPDEPIDIVVMLGAGERHGEASTDWAYGLLGRQFRDPATDVVIRNYTRSRRFALPGYGTRRVGRTDYSDQHVLTRDLGVPVRTYFGLDSRLATAALSLLTWIPGGSRAPRSAPLPGSDRWLLLARAESGVARWATGRTEAQGTADIAVAATRLARTLSVGAHHLHTFMSLVDVPSDRFEIGGTG